MHARIYIQAYKESGPGRDLSFLISINHLQSREINTFIIYHRRFPNACSINYCAEIGILYKSRVIADLKIYREAPYRERRVIAELSDTTEPIAATEQIACHIGRILVRECLSARMPFAVLRSRSHARPVQRTADGYRRRSRGRDLF